MGTSNVIRPVGVHPEALPPDYSDWDKPGNLVAALPGPVRRVLSSTGLQLKPASPHTGAQNMPAIASVDAGSPNTINIEDPARFNRSAPQTLTHEAIHLWQNNLPPHIQAQIPPDNPDAPYDYGGVQGLLDARAKGKKLINFPREVQSTIGQYYQAQGGDESAPDAIRKAYKPFVDDMEDYPLSTMMGTDPDQPGINTTARPPQGQMYSTQTFAKGDPAPGGMQKGTPVTLPDGTKGKVMHVIQGMGTLRVRTEDGRNLTVRAKAVKVVPHTQVAAHVRKLPGK